MNSMSAIYSDEVDKTGHDHGHSSSSSRSQKWANSAEAADPVDVNNADAAAHKSTACAAAVSSSATAATTIAWKQGCRVDRAPQDLSRSRENYCKSQCTKSDINIIYLPYSLYYYYYYYFIIIINILIFLTA
jgi:hypothetical protein